MTDMLTSFRADFSTGGKVSRGHLFLVLVVGLFLVLALQHNCSLPDHFTESVHQFSCKGSEFGHRS